MREVHFDIMTVLWFLQVKDSEREKEREGSEVECCIQCAIYFCRAVSVERFHIHLVMLFSSLFSGFDEILAVLCICIVLVYYDGPYNMHIMVDQRGSIKGHSTIGQRSLDD